MTTGFGFLKGAPDADALAYYRHRSRGVALAVVGFSAVAPEGRVENAIAWLWNDDAVGALTSLAEAVSGEGAVPAIQLGHGGRQVSPAVIGEPPVAPSVLPPAVHVRVPPRPLSTAEATDVIAAFGGAARRAADAGFAAVEIHGGHGYLISQFLSAASNHRSDRYGGVDAAGRSRFGCEVIESVKAAAEDLTVIVRINGSDLTADGLTPEDAVTAAGRFAEAGAEGFVVSAGVYGSIPWTIPLLDDPEGIFVPFAEEVRRNVNVPVAAVGRITTPELAEAALAAGSCDAVALGRALLADSDWVSKAAEGRSSSIRPCIATVQGCAGQLQFGEGISCSVNPEVGREALSALRPVGGGEARSGTGQGGNGRTAGAGGGTPGRILVVGGGPAGMEASRRAAELGHQVTLLESRERLGGALLLAALTPPLGHFERLVQWYEGELLRLGVEVRLGAAVHSADDLPEVPGADALMLATGAVTAPEALEGYEHLPAWTLEDLLRGEASSQETTRLEEPVAVLGGGSRALAAALWCKKEGCEVSLISKERFGRDTAGLTRRAYFERLGSTHLLRGEATRIVAGGVAWVDDDGTHSVLRAASLVVAEPVRPKVPRALGEVEVSASDTSAGGSAAEGVPVVRIGDARDPRSIGDAIAEARGAVNEFHKAKQARS